MESVAYTLQLCGAYLWGRKNSGASNGCCVTRKLPTCRSAWPLLQPGPNSRYVLCRLLPGGSVNPAQKEIAQPNNKKEHSLQQHAKTSTETRAPPFLTEEGPASSAFQRKKPSQILLIQVLLCHSRLHAGLHCPHIHCC